MVNLAFFVSNYPYGIKECEKVKVWGLLKGFPACLKRDAFQGLLFLYFRRKNCARKKGWFDNFLQGVCIS